ncbi:uncharacterized protein J3D65DRAFT_548352 [Phyllosticta citribraziliensis]|uniref:DUF159 domain protein n=1 Tax=Phyllosticta citribraziliensis TaxID=989973 RepID=A0ABR1M3X9_9PEZI
MCGRYALHQRPSEVRRALEQTQMPCEDAPGDDEVRQSYNFAPGYHGLVYRADSSAIGPGREQDKGDMQHQESPDGDAPPAQAGQDTPQETKYMLQAMKWGLIPSWTKRNPDYGSMMKTINCRDDSLIENRGLWNSMKHRKRCIVVAQGFYEWLKKNNGKEKIPHFVKRKDGQLMCFAGLWDCVKFEGSEQKLYTYTIITTDSNKQLKFLHDRMPVILDNGSEALRTWLDPNRNEWTKELQSLLKPYDGELECYAVSKDVGKVGNDSPSFIIPIDSKENKNNIANFFGNQKSQGKGADEKKKTVESDQIDERDSKDADAQVETQIKAEEASSPLGKIKHGVKREHDDDDGGDCGDNEGPDETESRPAQKTAKTNIPVKQAKRKAQPKSSPGKPKAAEGSKKITSFFGK